jgi:hypothetical protein
LDFYINLPVYINISIVLILTLPVNIIIDSNDTVKDLVIIVKLSMLIDSIIRRQVTLLEVSDATIYPLVTNYIIAYKGEIF